MKLLVKTPLLAPLLPLRVTTARDFAKVDIKTEKRSDTTYTLTGAGGNLGQSIGDDAVLVIDGQFAPLTPRIKEAIARLKNKPVQFVLDTHWHSDHPCAPPTL